LGLPFVASFRWGLCALGLALTATRGAEGPPAKPPAKASLGGAVAIPAALQSKTESTLAVGLSLTDRGDYAGGEIAYWQVLHDPEVTRFQQNSALLGLARLYRKQGMLTKAAAIYERFLKDRSDDERVPDALLELGRTLRDMSAYSLALNRFYSVINSTLKFPAQGFDHYQQVAKTAQFEIAQTHFEAGEYAEASKYFLKVRLLDLAPSDQARAFFMAAYSQQLAGEGAAAVTTLKSFLSDWPNDSNGPEARYLLATTLRQLNRPQEAMAVTLDLLKGERGQSETDSRRWIYWQRRTGNQVANELFQTGDVFNALAIYLFLQSISKDAAWRLPVTYQIALCYERLGQLDSARKAYAEIAHAGDPELSKMAAWRLAHLDWRDNTDRQFTLYLDSPGSHDSPGSAAAASTDLRPTSPARAGGEPVPAAASATSRRPAP